LDFHKLPQIDLRLLVVFDEIRKHRSLTLAADSLGVTQSAMSKSLHRLRHQLGDSLFVRTQKGMEPTARAKALEGPVSEILRTFHEKIAVAPPFEPDSSNLIFSIHASDIGMSAFLPVLAQELGRRAPRSRIAAITGNQKEVIEALEAGDMDLSLGAFSTLDEPGIFQQRLYVERYICLVRQGHPVLALPHFDAQAFREQSHVVIASGRSGHAHGRAEAILLEEIDPARVAMKVPGFILAAMLLRQSDHVLTIPSVAALTLAPEFGLVKLDCPIELPEFTVFQYWHERFSHDPAVQWLRSLIQDVFGRPGFLVPKR